MNLTFGDLSIKRKLVFMAMVSCAVALLLTASAFTVYDVISFRGAVSHELATVAQMLAESSAAALSFDDAAAAGETLAALKAEPRVDVAAIYRASGGLFAQYTRPGQKRILPPKPMADGVYFTEGRLRLYRSAWLNGERVGVVYLQSDLAEIQSRLAQYSGIALGVLVVGTLVALLVASKLQRLISDPILNLAETASLVAMNRDYAVRARKSTNDELGILVDRFNDMMAHIQGRDTALQAAQDELEDRVEDRTRELLAEVAQRRRVQEDLLTAKQAAEESNRAKSAFLANMSHELRTPLNAIIGYSEMLEEDASADGNDKLSQDLKKINGAGKHLLMLINDVLDLSKIEAGKMDLHLEMFRVADLLREAEMTAEPLARRNGNRLIVRNEDGGGMAYGDPIRFKQSLFNLLSNACKFTENGTVTLTVRREVNGDREWVRWAVTDTGIGIAEDDIAKLFRSFSQVDNSSTRKYQGTGLGLAISERLCRLMGGGISVDSEVGRGSTFTITLPGERLQEPAVPGEPGQMLAADRPTRTILVVDSDPEVQARLADLLKRDGYEAVAALTGDEALVLARRSVPDAIVVEAGMPAMEGWTVLQTLKADPFLTKVPVLLRTVGPPKPDAGPGAQSGEVLENPIPADQIVAVIRRQTQGRPAAGASKTGVRHALRHLEAEVPGLTEIDHGGLGLVRVTGEDTVSLDLVLPGTPGIEVRATLGRSGDWQTIPVVTVTSRPEMGEHMGLARLLGRVQAESGAAERDTAGTTESRNA